MGKMVQLFLTIRRALSTKKIVPVEVITSPVPVFDKKYKIIVKCKYTPLHAEMLEWVNNNSNGSVDVQCRGSFVTGLEDAYFGFQESGDALFFKIKFSI